MLMVVVTMTGGVRMAEPVLLQKGTLLRITINLDGGVRTSLDHNALYDIDTKDLIFALGCLRQLEHKLLVVLNDRDDD